MLTWNEQLYDWRRLNLLGQSWAIVLAVDQTWTLCILELDQSNWRRTLIKANRPKIEKDICA